MDVIAIGASKGGVGKTTLAAALAVEAAHQGQRVAIADFDPVQSLARWHDQRSRDDATGNLHLVDQPRSAAAAVRRAANGGFELLILDTPPAPIERMQPILKVADLIVVPVRPSPIDVQCLDLILELADLVELPRLVVLNAALPGSAMTQGARDYLMSRKFNLWEGAVVASELHASAMISGRTAAEVAQDSSVARDIQTLWLRVAELLRNGKRARPRPAAGRER